METIIEIVAYVLSPLYIYSVLWWIPLIFIMGTMMTLVEIFSGKPFKKEILFFMLSPYSILQITKTDVVTQRIIGIIFSLDSFALSYFIFSKNSDYLWATYLFIFLSIMMFLGIVFSFFTKSKK